VGLSCKIFKVVLNLMVKSLKKLNQTNKYFLKQILKIKLKSNLTNSTYSFNKALVIVKPLRNISGLIYKGNLFRKLFFTKYLLGYKFGEFTHTRKPFKYPIKKKQNKR